MITSSCTVPAPNDSRILPQAAAASFVNTACSRYPHREPPVTLSFEILWLSGLTFRSEEEIQEFTDLLTINNWMFILDTGHLMNGLQVRNEQEGIQKVRTALENLSEETIDRIRAIHFQCNTSGNYQYNHLGRNPPAAFSKKTYREKMNELMQHLPYIDEHRPFSVPQCREIIDIVRPRILIHEFVSQSREELHHNIQQQRALITPH